MRLIRNLVVPLLVAIAAAGAPAPSVAQVAASLSITLAPPPLPVYAQPAIPAPGYIWAPGYWAWGPAGYYWVPGTWVLPPAVGLLWTPGYWGWGGGIYRWHAGYWGPHVGFYGGINYGFGYTGVGYAGGYWQNGAFFYNRTVNNLGNARLAHVYTRAADNPAAVNRASFNGGTGGTAAHPTAQEQTAAREAHRQPTSPQVQHARVASTNPAMRVDTNHGQPAVAATQRPAVMPRPAAPPPRTANAPAAARPPAPARAAPAPAARTEEPRGGQGHEDEHR